MQNYDYVIAGGGAAGLSLAYYLSLSGLNNMNVLIIDKDKKDKNDRTWGFWSSTETAFDHLATFRFNQLNFHSQYFNSLIHLGKYHYSIIQGLDFYQYIKNHLSNFPNFEFLNTNISAIQDGEDGGIVDTGLGKFKAGWIFSSIFDENEIKKAAISKLYLRQHFKGWVIETPKQSFSRDSFSMFDFRTPQLGSMRFFYVIPYSENKALVEYTLFSELLLEKSEYDDAIRKYIDEVLQVKDFTIVEEEFGVIPMTNYLFPASQGRHIVNIGSLGGSSKPSSGYTFRRIQTHVQKIVAALEAGKSPIISANSSARYRFYDAVLLNILKSHGHQAEKLFSCMFKNNSIRRLFQFLDEEGGLSNDLKIISSLPPGPFLRSTFDLLF